MEDAISHVTSIHLIGLTVAIARNFALDKCNLNQTKILVLLKISKYAYLFELVFLYEPLRMNLDHLSTTLGVENDVESHCNVRPNDCGRHLGKLIGHNFTYVLSAQWTFRQFFILILDGFSKVKLQKKSFEYA